MAAAAGAAAAAAEGATCAAAFSLRSESNSSETCSLYVCDKQPFTPNSVCSQAPPAVSAGKHLSLSLSLRPLRDYLQPRSIFLDRPILLRGLSREKRWSAQEQKRPRQKLSLCVCVCVLKSKLVSYWVLRGLIGYTISFCFLLGMPFLSIPVSHCF